MKLKMVGEDKLKIRSCMCLCVATNKWRQPVYELRHSKILLRQL